MPPYLSKGSWQRSLDATMILDDGARSDVITEILTGVKVKVRQREADGILLALKKGAIG